MKKRIICILFILCMAFVLPPTPTLAEEDGVARIADTSYPTLSAAVEAVQEGQTIYLIKNTKENVWSNVNCSYTIDLNGKTLQAKGNDNALRKYGSGTLTICDTAVGGKITSACINSGTVFASEKSSGKIVIAGGTIENTLGSEALWIQTGDAEVSGGLLASAGITIGKRGAGNLSISGGTVSSTSTSKPKIAIEIRDGSMSISGGTVTSTGWAIDSLRAQINISGGSVNGGQGAIEANLSSTVNVSGGIVSSTGKYAIWSSTASVNVSGGTVSVNSNSAGAAIYLTACNGTKSTISGGTVDGGAGYGVGGEVTGHLIIPITIGSSGAVIKGENRAVQGEATFDGYKVKGVASLWADARSLQLYSKNSAKLYRYLRFEPNPMANAVITITEEPAALTTLTRGKISGNLSVNAGINVTEGVNLKYQWYYSLDNTEGKAIANATSATYQLPNTLTAKTHYYYCVVTADGVATARTQVAKVVVVEPEPAKSVITIKKQPPALTNVIKGKITGSLSVAAKVNNNKKLTYQWAVSTSGPGAETAVMIEGAVNATFYIPQYLTEGDYYYFCIVRSEGMEPLMTTVSKVTVKEDPNTKRIVLADTSGQSFLERKTAIIAYYKELNAMAKSLGTNKYTENPVLKAPYAAGALTPAYLEYATKTLNFVRFLSGLPDDIKTTEELNILSQEGALLLAVGTYSHTPDQPKDMSNELYKRGYKSTSSSNIAAGFDDLFSSLVAGWLVDGDEENIARVGHRRWALNPVMQYTGFGDAVKNYTMYSIDQSRTKSVDYYAVAYPSGAAFPSDIFLKNYPWSVSLNPNYYQTPDKDIVKVSMSGGGKTYEFSSKKSSFAGDYFNVDTKGYGNGSCIIFRPKKDTAYSGEYTVTITGLKTKSGEDTSLSYTVNFFGLNDATKQVSEEKQPKLKNGINILSSPTKTKYTVGDGFDPSGIKVVNYKSGKQTNITKDITFYTSKTVQLTKGRKFQTSGKKVVEIRYKGKKIGTYTINVRAKKK